MTCVERARRDAGTALGPFRAVLCVLLTLAFYNDVVAQRVGIQGYAKTLGVRSRSIVSEEVYVLGLNRVRMTGSLEAGERLHGELRLDTELLAGTYLQTADFALSRTFEPDRLGRLEWTIAEGDRLLFRQRLVRAFTTLYLPGVELTLGRQRIAWGTGFVWNPTDLLNPRSPIALERDEAPGVNAVRVTVPFSPLGRVEAVAATGGRRHDAGMAARVGSNWRSLDVSIMGGYLREHWVAGGDFAGYVGDAGIRGEVTYSLSPTGRGYVHVVLNADRTFKGGYYVLAELYHSGSGTRDPDRYDAHLLLSRPAGVAREYGAIVFNKALTPLVGVTFYALANLNDGSSLAGPSLTWSPVENLEMEVSTYLFVGGQRSEFGRLENVYFASLQYFF